MEGTDKPQRQAEIPSYLEDLESSINLMNEFQDQLESRLGPILSAAPPKDTAKDKPESVGATAIGSRLVGLVSNMNRMNSELSEIIERIQV